MKEPKSRLFYKEVLKSIFMTIGIFSSAVIFCRAYIWACSFSEMYFGTSIIVKIPVLVLLCVVYYVTLKNSHIFVKDGEGND